MKNILITGGAGFIGTNVSRQLLSKGFNITILDNFLPQIHGGKNELPADLAGKVRLIEGDVSDKDTFYAALKGQNAVIHYAAETGTGQSMYDISRYTFVNIQATSTLCDYIINEEHALETVIVASSRSIYGEGKYYSELHGDVYPDSRTFNSVKNSFEVNCPVSGDYNLEIRATDEASKIHPSSFYGITKQVQEQMVILAAKLKNINGFALRYQNVYGPGQSLKNPYTGILSIFSRLALQGEEINIFEDGLESRDFVYIDDVVKATVRCLDADVKGQHILNVGSGVPVTVLEVANEIVSYLKSASPIKISGAFREGDIRHNFADLNLVKNTLGFIPEWTFKDGLHKFIDWVLEQKDIPLDTTDYKRSLGELKEKGLLND
ncbi:dTDP-L-rhamnose 4-epimerase [Pedobacter steynii]|uniref:dTDP-L-rhamnose 4-epimerase n=1 Tax=Pedobacter steynii TaxID=430522 RepID=A0A1G9WIP0_9SPHI|nr:NAD-dependent epimerase/dehydratase family protein [Pedobacter steynii]NQX40298.1 NAD-dependent epimerase/dehydratase family protein [Pedobacter steynii]SDM83905.1 dTDP-L-rhamnose 4-epimerase [Pedobacter steynii]